MHSLLPHLKPAQHKTSILFMAALLLFMQCYLLQHQFEHQHAYDIHEHDSQSLQECQLCLVGQQTNEAILLSTQPVLFSVAELYFCVLLSLFLVESTRVILPHPRAPPVFF